MPMSVIDVNGQSLKEMIIANDKPVLLQVWAPWCGPCHVFSPVIDKIESEYGNKIVVARLNLENHPEDARELGIMDIPTVIVFVDGRRSKVIVGAHDKPSMVQYLSKFIA